MTVNPAFPDINVEEEFDGIPKSVMSKVLGQFGYGEDKGEEPTPEPATDPLVDLGAPPMDTAEPTEDDSDDPPLPEVPGGPLDSAANEPPGPGEEDSPAPPTSPTLPPAAETFTLPDGRVLTRQQIDALAALDAQISRDPELRETISRRLRGQAAPPAPAAPTSTPGLLPLPPVSPE